MTGHPSGGGRLVHRPASRRPLTALHTLTGFAAAGALTLGIGLATSTAATAATAKASSASTPASVVKAAQAAVTGAYKTGADTAPPATGPKAVKGANVWWISCGQQYANCAEESSDFQAAGKQLGWNVTVADGKAVPTTASSIILQAIAAHAKAIVVNNYDCPKIKNALVAAQHAHVPTIAFQSLDCNDPFYGGKTGYFTAMAKIDGTGPGGDPFEEKWGKLEADYLIAKTDGKATVLDVHETTTGVLQYAQKAYLAELGKAPGIKVVNAPFQFSQDQSVFTPEIVADIRKNPDVDSVQTDVDSMMGLGLETAIKESGHQFKWVFGAEGSTLNYQLERTGFQTDSVVRQDDQGTWATADTVNRILAGVKPAALPNEGGGFQIVDKSHNLPPASGTYKPALNYQALFEKIWKG